MIYKDFTLTSYTPPKIRGNKLDNHAFFSSILNSSFPDNGQIMKINAIKNKILTARGINQTIWGIKRKKSGEMVLEFYFYNVPGNTSNLTVDQLKKILSPEFHLLADSSEKRKNTYFMLSFEIDAFSLDNNNIYGCDIYFKGGTSLHIFQKKIFLKNYYRFFKSFSAVSQILKQLYPKVDVESQIPTFEQKGLVCLAKKNITEKRHDFCVYFNLVGIDALLDTIRLFRYPKTISDFIEKNKNGLDHFYFDIGLDLKIKNNNVFFSKCSFYGLL